MLSDAKKQIAVENQLLEQKSEILDAMSETVETNNTLISEVKDLVYNLRTEVKRGPTVKRKRGKNKKELTRLKREIKKFKENLGYPDKCPVCGKPTLPEFKVYPYCGANLKLLPREMVAIEKCKQHFEKGGKIKLISIFL